MKILKLKAKVLNVPILFTGDLLHKEKQVSNKLLSILLPFFKKIWGSSKYPTFAIDGNHDQCEENTLDHESPSYIKTFSQIYKGLNCVNNESVEYNNLMIHGVPYLTHDLGLNQAIDNRIKKINKKKMLKRIKKKLKIQPPPNKLIKLPPINSLLIKLTQTPLIKPQPLKLIKPPAKMMIPNPNNNLVWKSWNN